MYNQAAEKFKTADSFKITTDASSDYVSEGETVMNLDITSDVEYAKVDGKMTAKIKTSSSDPEMDKMIGSEMYIYNATGFVKDPATSTYQEVPIDEATFENEFTKTVFTDFGDSIISQEVKQEGDDVILTSVIDKAFMAELVEQQKATVAQSFGMSLDSFTFDTSEFTYVVTIDKDGNIKNLDMSYSADVSADGAVVFSLDVDSKANIQDVNNYSFEIPAEIAK